MQVPIGAQTEELIRVPQARASRIHKDLAANFKHVEVNKFLQEFDKLHEAHVSALRRNNLVEAHEEKREVRSLIKNIVYAGFVILILT